MEISIDCPCYLGHVLKFLDDMEQIREQEAKMSGKRFRPLSIHRTGGATGRRSQKNNWRRANRVRE